MSKPFRSKTQETVGAGSKRVDLYKITGNVVWGSDSRAHFLDIISVGPITSVKDIYVNETNVNEGEFPASTFYTHYGQEASTPWRGDFPYVERTYSLAKQAEVEDKETYTETTFRKTVSSLGVEGIRVNFTSPSFTHRDNKNRKKVAKAYFWLKLIDDNGTVVKTVTSSTNQYWASNPTSVQLELYVGSDYKSKIWTYEVSMFVLGEEYQTSVQGGWTASTVTEMYRDTQTYNDIAYCSGTIVAAEVEAKTPVRQYLVEGYKVDVPVLEDVNGEQKFLGDFTQETSDSYAWNSMAVLVNGKWGGGLDIGSINITDFLEFDRYCKEDINGNQRYSHSQVLVKSDNWFKIAQQMVGIADGKLYEDTSGRVGVLIDRKTDNRRVVTSYDVVDEKVKRTTVPEDKKLNYVEGEFQDKDNNYKKTILEVLDQPSIDENGVNSKKLKLDTTSSAEEANRILNKVLVVSKVASSSYVFNVGHAHEDVQIGEVIELYDRKYANANYCGKTAAGSTITNILIDPRTPIDISMIQSPELVLDNGRQVPTRVPVQSWTSNEIVLTTPLASAPDEFTSFGIQDADPDGIKPTLVRVLSVTDSSSGGYQVEGVEYNHSLYDHVDFGLPLEIPNGSYIPTESITEIQNLGISRVVNGLQANWTPLGVDWVFNFYWKRYGPDDGPNGKTVKSGSLSGDTGQDTLVATPETPLLPVEYLFSITGVDNDGNVSTTATATADLSVDPAGTSTVDPISDLGIDNEGVIEYTYPTRSLDIKWDHVEDPRVTTYQLKIQQNGTTLDISIPSDGSRTITVTELELAKVFGNNFERQFLLSIYAVDDNLETTPVFSRTVVNPAPPAPTLQVEVNGDVSLSLLGQLPEDVVGSITYIWEGSDPSIDPPEDSTIINTAEVDTVTVPSDTIVYDGRVYSYKSAWVDGFGEEGLQYGVQTFTANPDLNTPVPPELIDVIPVNEGLTRINFTHDGTFLRKIRAFFKTYSSTGSYTNYAQEFTIPVPQGETDWDYNPTTGEGYFLIRGLGTNTEYQFKAQAANESSSWSEDSNIINGIASFGIGDELDITLEGLFGTVDPRELIAEGVSDVFGDDILDKAIVKETDERISGDEQIVTDLTQLTARVETAETTSQAQYTELTQAIADEEQARITQVELLEASFEAFETQTNASISNVQIAIADEESARVVADEQLEAQIIGESITRSAQINQVSTAIATEEQTRAQQYTELTARVDGNDTDIATIINNYTATIGYCNIGGTQALYESESSCIAAGGTWVYAPFAEATRRVQITSGGETVTVGSTLTTIADPNNGLLGKAVLGVDAFGKFTGMNIVGGNSYSKITFNADVFELEDTSGSRALYWSSASNKWVFSGTVTASVIDGGQVNGATITGGSINIGNGNFSVDSSGVYTAQMGNGWYIETRVDVTGVGQGLQWKNSSGLLGAYQAAAGSDVIWRVGNNTISGRMIIESNGNDNPIVAISDTGGIYSQSDGNAINGTSTGGGIGVVASGGSWSFFDSSGAGYGPFTGGHQGLSPKVDTDPEVGDILVDGELINIASVSDAIFETRLSTKPKQKTATGIFVSMTKDFDIDDVAGLRTYVDKDGYLNQVRLMKFNSLGEGAVNVCGENGDIEAGDLIVTSSMAGKGMKQDDDIIRSYTVAKARHSVSFIRPSEVKQVACKYLSG